MNKGNRIELAEHSLRGLSVGDAFGESFFGAHQMILEAIASRRIPETSWEFTDDTVMATPKDRLALSWFESVEDCNNSIFRNK